MTDKRRAPTHPGAILREDLLPAMGVSVAQAAKEMQISRQQLHKVLAETAPITPESSNDHVYPVRTG